MKNVIDRVTNPETQNYLEEVLRSLDRLGDLEIEMVRENTRLRKRESEMEDVKNLCLSMMTQIQEQKKGNQRERSRDP